MSVCELLPGLVRAAPDVGMAVGGPLHVEIAQLRFSHSLLDENYLLLLIQSPLVQQQCTEHTRGVGNKNWVMRDIANTLVAIPPLAEQKRIVEFYASITPLIRSVGTV